MSVNTFGFNTQFLLGGGEMGELTRKKDWSKTPVGMPETWPQSLRTTLSILLNSKFPMFLWWGPELICFYNDAYRPSLGNNGKHPDILGMTAEQAWPEIWDIIKPLIDQVLSGGEATWSEDQLIPIYRNGKIEDAYWTFSYSAVLDESGKVGGVLVTCSETTEKINSFKNLEESNRRYFNNIIQAPVAMCILRGKDHVVEIANRLMLEIWGKTAEQVLNRPIFEGLPEAKGQGIELLLDEVFITGEKFVAAEHAINLPRNGKIETTHINFVYEALRDPNGSISGIMAIAAEVTLQVMARKKVEESEERFRTMAECTEILIALSDETGAATYFNKAWTDLTGRPVEQLLKFGWADLVHTEDRAGYLNIYISAFKKRKPFTGEFRVLNKDGQYSWLLAKGPPRFRPDGSFAGYISSCVDITERKRVEEDRQKLAAIVEASLDFVGLAAVNTSIQFINPAGLQMLGWDNIKERFIIDFVYPGDREFAKEILPQLLQNGSFQHEIRFWNEKTGKPFWLQWNGIAIKDAVSDEIIGLATVGPNITDRKQAEEALKQSEQRYRNLVMQSPIPMTIFRSNELIIEMANPTMLKNIWKKNETDVLGKKALDVFPELKEQKYPELLHEVYTTGKTHREIESLAYVQHDDGLRKFYLDFEYSPLFESDNSVSGIIITVNDVTVKVEARKKVEDAEERLRLAAEATELSTWDLDLQTREIIYSSRLAVIFGHTELKKLSHLDLRSQIHPDDNLEIVERAFEEALKTGVIKYEARVVKPDNGISWIRAQGKVFYDEAGQPIKLIGTLRDITEEKYQQQILEESEQKFRLLADSMPQHVWTGDPEGNLNYFNKAVLEYTGLTPDQFRTGGWIQMVHPDDRNGNLSKWIDSITQGKDYLFEHRLRRYDGEYRWQLSRAIPQKDAAGNIQMWVGTTTDIQEQKIFTNKLERQVRERTRELEQKNKELEIMNTELQSFAYVSSHDLQEPLRKIQTFSTRILEKEQQNLSENGKDYFRRMRDAAKRMQVLIEDLLTYSRTNTTDRNFENTDLNKIVTQVKTELKEDIEQKNAVIEITELCEVNVIPFQFRQLMHNLMGNALKFSKPGIPPHIILRSNFVDANEINNLVPASPQKTFCHISISDNGIGFEPRYKDRIFEVFQRLHGKDEYKGTGIGLAIVKKIVENHHGIITATSELNKGATFDIYLPAT